jgi:two-component sensor histidine kinase
VIVLGPSSATSLALVFHELATNAAKYGSLSEQAGRLSVNWRIIDEELVVNWIESGVATSGIEPSKQGFGTRLTKMSVHSQLSGSINYDWAAGGVRIRILVPTNRLPH